MEKLKCLDQGNYREQIFELAIDLLAKKFPEKTRDQLIEECNTRAKNAHNLAIKQARKAIIVANEEPNHSSLYFTEEQENLILILRNGFFGQADLHVPLLSENLRCVLGILDLDDPAEVELYHQLRALKHANSKTVGVRHFALVRGKNPRARTLGCCLIPVILLVLILWGLWNLFF